MCRTKKNGQPRAHCNNCYQGKYVSLEDALRNVQKEQKFQGVLKAQLMTMGFTLAVPEPDTGEDLWLSKLRLKSDPPDFVLPIFRAQVKSSYGYDDQKQARRYTTSINLANFAASLSQPTFVYFFGLRHEGNSQYHVGCIPSTYFRQWWYPACRIGIFGTKESRRVRIMFNVMRTSDNPVIEFYGGKGCRGDCSKYFGNLSLGIDEATKVPSTDSQ